jgi:RIO-like serine/threonine protein kinase
VAIRYREPRDLALQARILNRLAFAGYLVPRVHLITKDALVVDRIDGPTMYEDLLINPERIADHAALLAELHQRLQRLGILHRDLNPMNVILGPEGSGCHRLGVCNRKVATN